MAQNIVLTAVGSDRPGIVAAVSKVLYEIGCNIEDSSMTLLKGEFAMILIISSKEDIPLAQFNEKFDALREKLQLSIYLRELSSDELVHVTDTQADTYIISVYGTDKPGIVYTVTQLLSDKKINITDVNTHIAGTRGKPVYVMVLEVEVPQNISQEQLGRDLENIGKKLNVDVSVRPIETEEL